MLDVIAKIQDKMIPFVQLRGVELSRNDKNRVLTILRTAKNFLQNPEGIREIEETIDQMTLERSKQTRELRKMIDHNKDYATTIKVLKNL